MVRVARFGWSYFERVCSETMALSLIDIHLTSQSDVKAEQILR